MKGSGHCKIYFKAALKIIFRCAGVGIAFFLLYRTLKNTGACLPASLSPGSLLLLLLSLLLYGVVNMLAAWRWQLLLKIQCICIPMRDMLRLTFIGIFFSTIVPGGTASGDLIKTGFLAAMAKDKKTEALLTILVDRYIGLMGLFTVAAFSSLLCLLAYPGMVSGKNILLLAMLFVWAGFLGMLAGLAVLLARRRLLSIRIIAVPWNFLYSRMPSAISGILDRLAQGMDMYSLQPGSLFKALGIASGIHTMLAFMQFLSGKALGEKAMSLLQYVITTQLSNATDLFPLTPGGIGLRDSVSAFLLGIFSASPPEVLALIPLTYTLTLVIWAAVGALFLLFGNFSNSGADTTKSIRP